MKIFLLIIITSLLQIVNGQTNMYHKFPESSAFWNFHLESHSSQGNSCIGSQDYSIIITGDTVINATVYYKLNIPFIQTLNSPCGEYAGYKGAFRQDTILKKVYIIPNSQTSEQLLYDFNLQIGDTLKGYLSAWLLGYYNVVTSIDSVLVGNSFCKRWNMSDSCYIISIIEGVGLTYGLIEPSMPCVIVTQNYTLDCFNHNGITLYPSSAGNCEQVTQIKSFDNSSNKIKAFPNPFSSMTTLRMDSPLNNASLTIYNSFGKIVKQIKNISGQTVVLHRNNFASGLYLIRLTKYDKVISTEKIVITNLQ